MANKAQKQFWDDFEKKSQLQHCPFLYKWFESKIKEFNKVPDKPNREGIPKGETFPMPRMKLNLAILQIVHPNLRLKNFAGAYDLSYGSVRNWNIDGAFQDMQHKLQTEFVGLYKKRMEELIDSDEDINLLQEHCAESKYYQDVLLHVYMHRLIQELKDPVHSENWYRKLYAIHWYSLAQLEWSGGDEEHRKIFENLLLMETRMIQNQFKLLSGFIQDINEASSETTRKFQTEVALKALSIVQESIEPTLQERVEFGMQLYDLQRKKKTRKKK